MGAELDTKTGTLVTIIGAVFIIFIWYLVTTFGGISNTIFPKPQDVFTSLENYRANMVLLAIPGTQLSLIFMGISRQSLFQFL